MLVLSRKAGQTIQIGPDVSVTVVKLSSGAVRLGVVAPPEMAVVRGELVAELEAERESAEEANSAESLRLFTGDYPEA